MKNVLFSNFLVFGLFISFVQNTCPGPHNDSLACQYEDIFLTCTTGSYIVVKSVFWGRNDTTTCVIECINQGITPSVCDGLFNQNTECSSTEAFSLVSELCNGFTECGFPVIPSLIGEPCAATFKYLMVQFECIWKPLLCECEYCRVGVACENNVTALMCPPETVFFIEDAQYGRQNQFTCPNGLVTNPIDCITPNAVTTVSNLCNFQSSCNFLAPTTFNVDPCPGVTKYSAVCYSCNAEIVICDGYAVFLSCPPPRVIRIPIALYGRAVDPNICTSASCLSTDPNCPYYSYNANCQADVTSTIKIQCDGQPACIIAPFAAGFNDTCPPNTYKYLRFLYSCDLPV